MINGELRCSCCGKVILKADRELNPDTAKEVWFFKMKNRNTDEELTFCTDDNEDQATKTLLFKNSCFDKYSKDNNIDINTLESDYDITCNCAMVSD